MNKKWIGVAVVVGLVLFLASRKKVFAGAPKLFPGGGYRDLPAVKKGEKLTAKTFTAKNTRRSGYAYAPAKLLPDGTIEFTSPKTGFFTRVVYKSPNGQIYAEIK